MSIRRLLPSAVFSFALLCTPLFCWSAEGIVEINQARAEAGEVTGSDTAGFPVTIDSAGKFALTGNLSAPSGTTAIQVSADNVSLDLRGFRVSGMVDFVSTDFGQISNGYVNGARLRMGSFATVDNVSVSNGRISAEQRSRITNSKVTGSGSHGIITASGAIIINNHVDGPDECISGIYDAPVKNNFVANCGATGIDAFDRARIEGNTVVAVSGHGINVSQHALVVDNMVSNCQAHALVLGDSSGYRSNVFVDNNGGNSNPQVSGGTELADNICGNDATCP